MAHAGDRQPQTQPSHLPVQIRATVVRAVGSTPRDVGAAMLVTAQGPSGTIGGGALELAVIHHAVDLLSRETIEWYRELRSFALGPSLGQCCGGQMSVLFECERSNHTAANDSDWTLCSRPFTSGIVPVLTGSVADQRTLPKRVVHSIDAMQSGSMPVAPVVVMTGASVDSSWLITPRRPCYPQLYVYGAGHVGRAVINAFSGLPFSLNWVDTAVERFPAERRDDVTILVGDDPAQIAAAAPAGALHLIMTYSHAIDLQICRAVLATDRFAWVGLIGSATKRARFESRLGQAGIRPQQLERLRCPIGIAGITSKAPEMIAIAVAAELAIWSEQRGVQAQA
jgi:xanthine dehydrogenase accessory factor